MSSRSVSRARSFGAPSTAAPRRIARATLLVLGALAAALLPGSLLDAERAIAAQSVEQRADVNRDGYVNLLDLVFVAYAMPENDSRGDVNLDGHVNILDLSIVSRAMIDSLAASGRDKLKWPFSWDSPWNMPIGSLATYVPAGIGPARTATADIDFFFVLSGAHPKRPVYRPVSWGPGRCTMGGAYEKIDLPVPDSLIIPDATASSTPNNASAFLMPDGQTLVQLNPLARCEYGGPVFGYRSPDQSIYGKGILGGHGGSGLSSIGGTIRLGELIGDQPIRHALKVNLWCSRYCSYTTGGYRWPAIRSDAYASPVTYGGTNAALKMGSLLAIPPWVTEASLGLETAPGRKLFRAMQDYGAYVVDDTMWDAHAIAVENGVPAEFQAAHGYNFTSTSGPFYRDYMRLFSALHVVDNNSATSTGGGGTPRTPYAPPISN